LTTEIKRFDRSFNNMRKNLKNADFKLIAQNDQFEIWVTPRTGRVLHIGTYDHIASRVICNGGMSIQNGDKIEAVIHQLNSDEHYLIDKML
jgi:hypothetical protein